MRPERYGGEEGPEDPILTLRESWLLKAVTGQESRWAGAQGAGPGPAVCVCCCEGCEGSGKGIIAREVSAPVGKNLPALELPRHDPGWEAVSMLSRWCVHRAPC